MIGMPYVDKEKCSSPDCVVDDRQTLFEITRDSVDPNPFYDLNTFTKTDVTSG